MKKIAFVINPNSGVSDKKQVIAFLHDKFINSQELFVEFYYTKGKGDATIAAQKFSENNFDVVVAVGGDGTVNETSRGLLNSKTSLAIIPSGSGNGLARHLKIPLSYKKASELILTGKDISIDVGKINDEYFFCTAGIGFDAVIGEKFNSAGTRGILTYIEQCTKEYIKYRPEKYKIIVADNILEYEAFLITFANSSQWGNNAFISPDASISDGFLDMVVWKKTPLITIPILAADLFLKTIKYSEHIDIFRCNEVKIIRESDGVMQFDGESVNAGKEINVSILHNSLKVIVENA